VTIDIWRGGRWHDVHEVDNSDRLLSYIWDGSRYRKLAQGLVWRDGAWREFYNLENPPPPGPPCSGFDPWKANQRWQRIRSPYLRGRDIRTTQSILSRAYNIGVGPVDGIYGPRTRSGVVTFQRAQRILVDGIVGPQTWTTMFGDRSRQNMYG
jgi:hypothetical protein